MPLTSNQAGQMYALTVMSPVVPSRAQTLRDILDRLPRRPSPFARLTSVHFARWVFMPNFVADPSQPAPEHLPAPYLLFSATFDGSLDAFLEDLTTRLAAEAEGIYGSCIGAPEPPRGHPLQDYLRHNQVQTGLFFAAYPDATVEMVRDALSVRERVIQFAIRGQGMRPDELRDSFRREF